MSWYFLYVLIFGLMTGVLLIGYRRLEIRETADNLAERQQAKTRGSHKAQLQYPWVDLSKCIGCGTCIRACPEEGVLGLIHGQSAVIHGARCIGHGLCAKECPVGGIVVTLADMSERRDIPAIDEHLEVKGLPGVFLAGEVTGFALIRTAISHGTAVAEEVARRLGTPEAEASPARAQANAGPPQRQSAFDTDSSGGLTTLDYDGSWLLRDWTAPETGVLVDDAESEPAPSPAQPVAPAEGHITLPNAEYGGEILDVCVIGAGPAGLACALQSKARGLNCLTLDQEEVGGTVAKYPRRKLVMTQPVFLPLHGQLKRTSYRKEELMGIWAKIVEQHDLKVRTGEVLAGIEPEVDGTYTVKTSGGSYRTRNVCLALGRRGTPRKLGIDGEDLPKVAYSLVDAQSYEGRNILVVGGGDSAIEAAVGLAKQEGNQVTLSYRKHAFFRIKARNEARIAEATKNGSIKMLWRSQVKRITEDSVLLEVAHESGSTTESSIENDEVFVFAGGIPPFKLLGECGVSFDPADRPPPTELTEQGTGLFKALVVTLVLSVLTLIWTLLFVDYYKLPMSTRAASPWHDLLKPRSAFGIGCGIVGTLLILANLSYLLRRSKFGKSIPGSLQSWMTSHLITGIFAFLLILVHAALSPRNTVGGHAFVGLATLVATGAVGRYLYSFIPRAANGTELALEDLQSRLATLSSEWDQDGQGFGERVRAAVQALIPRGRWRGNFFQRVRFLLGSRRKINETLAVLKEEGLREGLAKDRLNHILRLARKAHRTATSALHYEEIRGILGSWRYFHRWIALLMVLLAAVHIATAIRIVIRPWFQ